MIVELNIIWIFLVAGYIQAYARIYDIINHKIHVSISLY